MGDKKKTKKQKAGGGHKLYAIVVLALALAIFAMSILLFFHVQTIEISGNKYVESSNIAKSIQSDKYATNTLYIMIKNSLGKIRYPKSVESVRIFMTKPWSIKVVVKEKKAIGCAIIQDEYIVFDEDGIVLGTAPIQPEGIRLVEGIQAEEAKIGEKLPVKEDRVFRNIMELSEALAQHEIKIDRMTCDGANVTVYIGGVCVALGSGEMELKVNQLPDILTKLEGKNGTLDLRHYNEMTEIISFKEKK